MSQKMDEMLGIEDNKVKLDSLLWRAVFATNKISKGKLETISVSEIIKQCKTKSLTLQSAAIIIMALSKINKRQTKQVLEDCIGFLKAVSGEIKKTIHGPRPPKEKRKTVGNASNINASIMDEEAFKQTTLEISAHNNFDNNTDFMMEPEMVRQSNENEIINSHSAIFNSSTKESEPRRKSVKLISDKKTEIKLEDIKKKINMVMKKDKEMAMLEKHKEVIENYSTQLFLDEQILSAIKTEIDAYNAEVVRNSAVASAVYNDNFDNHFENSVDFDFGEQEHSTRNVTLNFEEVEDAFDFTQHCQGLPKEEQAQTFFELLNKLSQNTHSAKQTDPYGTILISKKDN